MPTLKTGEVVFLEVQATVRSGDANPTASTIGIAIRYFSNGHSDDESYWSGSVWQKAATVVTSTQKDFHAHEYELPDTALVSGMEGGRLVARAADAGAIGPAVEWDVVAAKLDDIVVEINANEAKIDALPDAAAINAECDQALTDYNPSTTAELAAAVTAISGADGDDLKDISDELAAVELAIRGADSDTLETLSDQIDLVQPPAGLYEVTIHTQDGGGAPIPLVDWAVYDETNVTQIWSNRTNASGNKKIYLNAGTYKVRKSKNWFEFLDAETMVVTKDETFNFVGIAFVAPSPSGPGLCSIYGYTDDAAGVRHANATVEAFAVTPQVVDDFRKTNRVASVKSDAVGYYVIELSRKTKVRFRIYVSKLDVERTVPDLSSKKESEWT